MPPASEEWRPAGRLDTLRQRSRLIGRVREFFAQRAVWEVETPVLARAGATDPHLESLNTHCTAVRQPLYLQTSPEAHMKRLLAAGSGAIYQISRAFRDGERGKVHNTEFTLLEWYRPGFDHHRLMDEVDELIRDILAGRTELPPSQRRSYAEAMKTHTEIDPFNTTADACRRRLLEAGIAIHGVEQPPAALDFWLDLLMSHLVGPELGRSGPTFVYDFPASQAALSRIRPGQPPLASRFELFLNGMELANGFHELRDPREQRARFEADLAARQAEHLPQIPIDEFLLAALDSGLPDCAGVALGLDRLIMIALDAVSIDDVLAFPVDRA